MDRMGDSSVSWRLVAQLCALSCAGAAPPRLVQSETVHFAEHVMPFLPVFPSSSLSAPHKHMCSQWPIFPWKTTPQDVYIF